MEHKPNGNIQHNELTAIAHCAIPVVRDRGVDAVHCCGDVWMRECVYGALP
jgi:hypothetical protein